ncbi:hypothetical protein EEB13_30695 [Rhodococcus sp. WS3]|nr:hypothetical protein SZ00_06140 [Rhodococcus sp. AD45]ROZ42808.1 hypothetical protein EEB13_30695 [Rhodococcus sp. WS3]
MCIRQTATESAGIARLVFDAFAALKSIVVVAPLTFVVAQATAGANGPRADLNSPSETVDEHLCGCALDGLLISKGRHA